MGAPGTGSSAVRGVVIFALVMVALGATGYSIERGASAEPRPDEIGFGVPWSHELHARHGDYNCQSCHHTTKAGQSDMRSCDASGCHPRGPARPAKARRRDSDAPDQRSALHKSCVGCHNAAKQGPQDCAGCHSEHRGVDRCGSCHQDTVAAFTKGSHAGVACAACHTTLENNLEDGAHPRAVPSVKGNRACRGCHEGERDIAGFPSKRLEKRGSHEEIWDMLDGMSCADCHPAHDPRSSS